MAQCWLGNDIVSLPDIDTENDYVIDFLDQWAKEMIANYSSRIHGSSPEKSTHQTS